MLTFRGSAQLPDFRKLKSPFTLKTPMRYGELRWPDIASLDKDRVVVIIPIASLEQHGHHCRC
jgi:hypothetical protein